MYRSWRQSPKNSLWEFCLWPWWRPRLSLHFLTHLIGVRLAQVVWTSSLSQEWVEDWPILDIEWDKPDSQNEVQKARMPFWWGHRKFPSVRREAKPRRFWPPVHRQGRRSVALRRTPDSFPLSVMGSSVPPSPEPTLCLCPKQHSEHALIWKPGHYRCH